MCIVLHKEAVQWVSVASRGDRAPHSAASRSNSVSGTPVTYSPSNSHERLHFMYSRGRDTTTRWYTSPDELFLQNFTDNRIKNFFIPRIQNLYPLRMYMAMHRIANTQACLKIKSNAVAFII